MTIKQMIDKLKTKLSDKKFVHSLNVMNMSATLAKKYGQDVEKAKIAGLLHDCAKDMSADELLDVCYKFNIHVDDGRKACPKLLHAQVGAKLAQIEYEVDDAGIIDAISKHTTGDASMNLTDKIIFMADYAEIDRNFEGVEGIRNLCFKDIDTALLMALDNTIRYVLAKGTLLHIDTVNARNGILKAIHLDF